MGFRVGLGAQSKHRRPPRNLGRWNPGGGHDLQNAAEVFDCCLSLFKARVFAPIRISGNEPAKALPRLARKAYLPHDRRLHPLMELCIRGA